MLYYSKPILYYSIDFVVSNTIVQNNRYIYIESHGILVFYEFSVCVRYLYSNLFKNCIKKFFNFTYIFKQNCLKNLRIVRKFFYKINTLKTS